MNKLLATLLLSGSLSAHADTTWMYNSIHTVEVNGVEKDRYVTQTEFPTYADCARQKRLDSQLQDVTDSVHIGNPTMPHIIIRSTCTSHLVK